MQTEIVTNRAKLLVSFAVLFGFCLTNQAFASFIKFDLIERVTVNPQEKVVQLEMELVNQGDESAKSIELSFPGLGLSFGVASELVPNKPVSKSLTFDFEQLGLSERGVYLFPYHVLYKDLNHFPFSAPGVLRVVLPPAPNLAARFSFDDLSPGEALQLSSSSSLSVRLENVSGQNLSFEDVKIHSPIEIATRLNLAFPTDPIETGESLKFDVSVLNRGALPSSSYPLVFIASGVGGTEQTGKYHFATKNEILVKVVKQTDYAFYILGLGILVVALGYALKNYSKHKQDG